MSQRSNLLALLLLSALGGCAVGPDPSAPIDIAVGERFVEAPASPETAVVTSAWGFEAPELDWLLDAALETNGDLRAALARAAEAEALAGGAAADRWPSIDAVGEIGRRRDSGLVDDRGGEARSATHARLGLQSSWEIDLWGRARRTAEAASFDALESRALAADLHRSIAAEIATEFVLVRGAQARRAAIVRAIENQRRIETLTDALATSGAATAADVRRIRARRERTAAALPQLDASIRVSIHRLAALTSRPVDAIEAALAERMAELPVPRRPDVGVPSDLLRRRPDVRAAEHAIAASAARVGVATADLFPRVVLAGDLGVASEDLGRLFVGDAVAFGVGPSLRWPLLDFGRVRARIEAMGARQEAALAAYEQTVRQAIAEVESALAEGRGALGERERLAVALSDVDEARRLIELRYGAGADSLLAVLDVERERIEVEEQLVAARTRELLAAVSLSRALGALPVGRATRVAAPATPLPRAEMRHAPVSITRGSLAGPFVL